MPFISRQEKAAWGIPCNQKADSSLWVGKGYEKSLDGQLGPRVAVDLLIAISAVRGDRCGRFWVDMEEHKVTMAVGNSADNTYDSASF